MQFPVTDELTGLLSYSGWKQALDEVLAAGRARGVILLDLDRFAMLNQVEGHLKGDEALVAVAGALKRTGLLLGRVGGDQFVGVVLEGDTEAAAREAWRQATELMAAYETQAIRDLNAELSKSYAAIAKRDGWPEGPLRTNAERVLEVSAVAFNLETCQLKTDGLLRRLYDALDKARLMGRGRFVMLHPHSDAEQWRADNQEALDSSNEFAEQGLPLEKHRRF